jgi:hypothetical protein
VIQRTARRIASHLTKPPVKAFHVLQCLPPRGAQMSTTHTTIGSPLGELILVAEDGTLSGVYFPGHWTRRDPATCGARSEQRLEQVEQQLVEYFAGERKSFGLPTSVIGNTFQRQVWDLIDRIPYGHTTTYGQLEIELGRPHAGAQGRQRRRPQPALRHRPLPPRRGQGRQAHRLRRRAAAQAVCSSSKHRWRKPRTRRLRSSNARGARKPSSAPTRRCGWRRSRIARRESVPFGAALVSSDLLSVDA